MKTKRVLRTLLAGVLAMGVLAACTSRADYSAVEKAGSDLSLGTIADVITVTNFGKSPRVEGDPPTRQYLLVWESDTVSLVEDRLMARGYQPSGVNAWTARRDGIHVSVAIGEVHAVRTYSTPTGKEIDVPADGLVVVEVST